MSTGTGMKTGEFTAMGDVAKTSKLGGGVFLF